MKARVRLGYEGTAAEDVLRYGELCPPKGFRQALGGSGAGPAEVPKDCGTGIALLLALNKGAAAVTGADSSADRLRECKGK